MLKLAGSILLVFAGGGIGFLKADKLVQKHKNIKLTVQMLCDVEIMLDSSCLTREEILCRLEESKSYSEFFQSEDDFIDDEDMKELSDFFEQLGSTDLEGQLAKIRLCMNSFKNKEKEYALRAKKFARLYRGMGVLIGAMLAVMLI